MNGRKWACGLLAVGLSSGVAALAQEPGDGGVDDRRIIEIAIVLDSSGSMKPLIDAARLSLWDLVNDLSLVSPSPELRVAVVGYGGRGEGHQNGWVKVRAPLTEDLDQVSGRLFEITTGGGTEYVGRALRAALEELAWSPPEAEALQMIFVAGNEPADQDPEVDFRAMAEEVRARGIVFHAVYCGQAEDAQAATWKELAEIAEGRFSTIDLRSAASLTATPVDGEMARLGSELNRTFVPYGKDGGAGKAALTKQDELVGKLGSAAAAARAQTKAGALHVRSWDLVDAVEAGRVDLATIDPAALPETLRKRTPEERRAEIERLAAERATIRTRILELGAERRRFVAGHATTTGPDAARTFDAVVRDAVRRKVEEEGFRPGGE